MSRIITLTGPSGVGKSYIKRRLKAELHLVEIPVFTTRNRRNENENSERIFVTEEEFLQKLYDGELIFMNCLYGARYAFSSSDINRMKQPDGEFILELYIGNVRRFRNVFPFANMIAIVTDSMDLLRSRLRKRLEDEADIELRLKGAEREIQDILYEKELFDVVYFVDYYNGNQIENEIIEYVRRYLDANEKSY